MRGTFDLKDHRARQAARQLAIEKARAARTLIHIAAKIDKDTPEAKKND